MSGCFAGGPVSVGFMVDVRAEVGGTPNPNYKKYTPFQPYAEVVLEYFRLLVEEFAGNKTACARHISLYGPYYPSLTHVPDGFKVGKRYPCSKSYPTLPGLEKMWTNAVYIGHWAVEGCIIKRNNHPAIVPEDLFMAAFNYLSPIGLDGTPNPNYRPVREHARPMLEEHRKAERPLYAGLVYIRLDKQWRVVGTEFNSKQHYYRYTARPTEPLQPPIFTQKADGMDDAITALLLQKLELTFQADTWEATLSEFRGNYTKERKRRMSRVRSLQDAKKAIFDSRDKLTDPQFILSLEEQYKAINAEIQRLQAELAQDDEEARQLDKIHELRGTCGPALENWSDMPRARRQAVAHAFINRIEARKLSRGVIQLTIR